MPFGSNLFKESCLVVRFLLRGKSAVIGTGLLFALGVAMIYGDDFVLGMLALTFAGVWGIAAWLVSEELEKRKPSRPRKPKYTALQGYRQARVRYFFWKLSIPAAIVFMLVLSGVFANNKREKKILKELHGVLLPDHDPDLEGPCKPEGNQLAIRIGSNSVTTDSFPLTVIKAGGIPVLTMDRLPDGRISTTLDVRDQDGKIIVRLDKEGFVVNPNNYLSVRRPDKSSLEVIDQYGNEALKARYRNRRFFDITARINSNGRTIDLGNLMVSGTCVYNFKLGPDAAIIALP